MTTLRTAAPLFASLMLVGCNRGATPTPSATHANDPSRPTITVDGEGYHPTSVQIAAGRPTTLVFTRTSDEGCGQQVVFPTLNIQRNLPLNQPVEVALGAQPAGTLNFTCGMGMFRGTVVAR